MDAAVWRLVQRVKSGFCCCITRTQNQRRLVILKLLKNFLPEIIGAIFAIFILILGYILLPLANIVIEKIKTENIELFPITVIAAIALFFTKETIEFYKKGKERKRKISAIKTLISEEIRLNYWAFHQIKYILEFEVKLMKDPIYKIREKKCGNEMFEITSTSEKGIAWNPFPKISETIYHKNILYVAEQEPDLYKLALNYHNAITELQHIRNGFYEHIDDSGSNTEFRCPFIEQTPEELPDIYESMNVFFIECTGFNLESYDHKMR